MDAVISPAVVIQNRFDGQTNQILVDMENILRRTNKISVILIDNLHRHQQNTKRMILLRWLVVLF